MLKPGPHLPSNRSCWPLRRATERRSTPTASMRPPGGRPGRQQTRLLPPRATLGLGQQQRTEAALPSAVSAAYSISTASRPGCTRAPPAGTRTSPSWRPGGARRRRRCWTGSRPIGRRPLKGNLRRPANLPGRPLRRTPVGGCLLRMQSSRRRQRQRCKVLLRPHRMTQESDR